MENNNRIKNLGGRPRSYDVDIQNGQTRKNVVNVAYMVNRYATDEEYKAYRKVKAAECYKRKKEKQLAKQ